jgi:hypothetical protein
MPPVLLEFQPSLWYSQLVLGDPAGEFCNASNHPQFANPNTTFGSSTFGIISSAAVNARVGQLALKLPLLDTRIAFYPETSFLNLRHCSYGPA